MRYRQLIGALVLAVSLCGSFGAPSTTKSGVRVAGLAAALFVAGAGAGVAGAGAEATGVFGTPIGSTLVPKYGETSSGSPCSG